MSFLIVNDIRNFVFVLDAFLYEIYEKCPLQISIKTRLGISDLKEWERLLDIYARYPVQELIVHTRLLQEFYTGAPHPEAFAMALCRLRDTAGESARSAARAGLRSRPRPIMIRSITGVPRAV